MIATAGAAAPIPEQRQSLNKRVPFTFANGRSVIKRCRKECAQPLIETAEEHDICARVAAGQRQGFAVAREVERVDLIRLKVG